MLEARCLHTSDRILKLELGVCNDSVEYRRLVILGRRFYLKTVLRPLDRRLLVWFLESGLQPLIYAFDKIFDYVRQTFIVSQRSV